MVSVLMTLKVYQRLPFSRVGNGAVEKSDTNKQGTRWPECMLLSHKDQVSICFQSVERQVDLILTPPELRRQAFCNWPKLSTAIQDSVLYGFLVPASSSWNFLLGKLYCVEFPKGVTTVLFSHSWMETDQNLECLLICCVSVNLTNQRAIYTKDAKDNAKMEAIC